MTARVVLLTTNLAPGGAETQVAQLAVRLRARGWDVHVISLLQPIAFLDELTSASVPVNAPGLAGLSRLILEIRPAILHSHMFHANILARAVRLLAPVPVAIGTLHSSMETSRGAESARLRDLTYRLTDPWSDVTVAVSEAVARRHAESKAVPRRKLRVIPNAVDTDLFSPALPSRAGRSDDPFSWLAAGRLMWKKDFTTLLDAFVQLRGCELLIAGAGPDEAKLRAIAPANVFFLGQRDDLPSLMRRADAFVLSSRIEGLPVVLLEAAACALPCVATEVGGVREIGVPFTVPPRDPMALAEAMKRVMTASPAERRALGDEARRRAVERFSWPVVLGQWESLYREGLQWT